MVNSWSLLYDAMEEDKIVLNYDREPVVDYVGPDSIFNVNLNESLPHYRFNEDAVLKTAKDYIASTYRKHYTSDKSPTQTLDLIASIGDGEPFCRSNAIKYLSRYDKKGSAKNDILKAIHYCVLLYNFVDQSTETETYETF